MNNSKGSWSTWTSKQRLSRGVWNITLVSTNASLRYANELVSLLLFKQWLKVEQKCKLCLCVRINMQFCLQGYCLQECISPRLSLQRDVLEQNVRIGAFTPSTLAQAVLVHHFLFRLMLCGFKNSAVAYSLVHCIIRHALTQFLSPASSQVSGCDGTASISKRC